MRRIGFCGTYTLLGSDRASQRQLNPRGTTLAALRNLSRDRAYRRLAAIVQHNLAALQCLFDHLAQQPPHNRFYRIAHHLLPFYADAEFGWVYDADLYRHVTTALARVGATARQAGIRVTMRCCHPLTVKGPALIEITRATDILRWMGFTERWHDATLSIGIETLDDVEEVLNNLSAASRRILALETDTHHDIEALLPLSSGIPIVVDLLRHWATHRAWLAHDDLRCTRVQASWRDVRPYSRLSMFRQKLGGTPNHLPHFEVIDASETQILVPSADLWNTAVNDWAAQHLRWTDIEVVASKGNIAAQQLIDQAVLQGHL